ncbi:uncharacterized protein LOC113289409 [Papaver somniferum]|uniref:uncharacterized protein LOC113289409 n=1 Tax=Papaver somniferum TaxID=3469 RepID=UPI000E6F7CBC|nr:uncharacterized protein LOC113289409 [Papaver somniferum]
MVIIEELEETEFVMGSTPCSPETISELPMTPEETTTRAEDTSFSTRNKKNLTNEQRLAIYHFLLKESNKGKLQRGSIPMAAQQFSVSETTVKRIWKLGKESQGQNLPVDVSSRKPTRVGRKAVEVDLSKIPEIPLQPRTSIRTLAKALNVSASTLHRRMKKAGRSW